MNWKIKMGTMMFKFWRNLTAPQDKERISNEFYFVSATFWNFDTGKMTDFTFKIQNLLEENSKIRDHIFNDNSNCIVEIRYRYRGLYYRILYNKIINFPPYVDDSQTPLIRLFSRDFSNISIDLIEYETEIDQIIGKEIEIEEPDMNQLLIELRGPGNLFHLDVSNCCQWDIICKWIKIFYLEFTKIEFTENNIEVRILWSNGDEETF